MKLEIEDIVQRYRLLPIQVVTTSNGLVLRRGVERFRISGDGAQEVLEQVLQAASREQGATIEELCTQVSGLEEADIRNIVDQLVLRRFLVEIGNDEFPDWPQPNEESSSDVFYWQYGVSPRRMVDEFRNIRMAIVGVNHISQRLVSSFQQCGFDNFCVIDHPMLRNLRLFDNTGSLNDESWASGSPSPTDFDDWVKSDPLVDCLVVASDFGGMGTLREWNDFAVRSDINFFPVILQDGIGMVGPLVIPHETACYECLWARQNSHLIDPERQRAAEDVSFYGQLVNGYLQPMASILAEITAMELVRAYSKSMKESSPGRLVEVDLTEPSLQTRKVLKVPRCPVCGPLTTQASRTVDQNVFMVGNENNP